MIEFDASGLMVLVKKLQSAGKALDRPTLSRILRGAAKPMEEATRSEAPVGQGGAERISLRARTRSNEYRRGGATRRDIRTKIVEGTGDILLIVLIGVSKLRGKVGWRTPFITRGTRKMRANDFLARGYRAKIDTVLRQVQTATYTLVTKILK